MHRSHSDISFVSEEDRKSPDLFTPSTSFSKLRLPNESASTMSIMPSTLSRQSSSVTISLTDDPGWDAPHAYQHQIHAAAAPQPAPQKAVHMHLRSTSVVSDADLDHQDHSGHLSYKTPPPSDSTTRKAIKNLTPKFYQHPPASTKEPFRDFSGYVTIHRVFLCVWVFGVVSILMSLQDYVFPPHPERLVGLDRWFAREEVGYILLIPVIFYIMAFVGAFWFKVNTKLDETKPTNQRVVWRVVSRGLNRECILETVRKIRLEMRRNPLFPYLIEIVTDTAAFDPPSDPDVIHLQVPLKYESPNGTKFKARSLHYACGASVVPGDSWIVHLDEETRPTSSAVKGIAAFIESCARTGEFKKIGQGCMLYHRSWNKFPILTLADMRRTGDDFGHFYLQNRLGVANVGLHGAFIVVRAAEEAKLGFDVGPNGSITEDAWWVFLAMRDGFRLAWVDGFLEEQATESLGDFLKQRRRWMYGLQKTMFLNPSPARYRMVFVFFMTKWLIAPFLAPFQMAYVGLLIFHDLGLNTTIRVLSLFNVAMILYGYMVGWFISLREGMAVRRSRILPWSIALVLLVPFFQVLEVVALFMSFFARFSKSGRGFHVVEKSVLKDNKKSEPEVEL